MDDYYLDRINEEDDSRLLNNELVEKLKMARCKLAPIIDDMLYATSGFDNNRMFLTKFFLSNEQCEDVMWASEILEEIEEQITQPISPCYTLPNSQVIVNNVSVELRNDTPIYIDEESMAELLELYERMGIVLKRMVATSSQPPEQQRHESLKQASHDDGVILEKNRSNISQQQIRRSLSPSQRENNRSINSRFSTRGSMIEEEEREERYSTQSISSFKNRKSAKFSKSLQESIKEHQDSRDVIDSEPEKKSTLSFIGKSSSGELLKTNDKPVEKNDPNQNPSIYIRIKCYSDTEGVSDNDSEELTETEPCTKCENHSTPHVHVKLGGEPVTLKVNQDSIDEGGVYCINTGCEEPGNEIKIVIKQCPECCSTVIGSSTKIEDVLGESHESITLHGKGGVVEDIFSSDEDVPAAANNKCDDECPCFCDKMFTPTKRPQMGVVLDVDNLGESTVLINGERVICKSKTAEELKEKGILCSCTKNTDEVEKGSIKSATRSPEPSYKSLNQSHIGVSKQSTASQKSLDPSYGIPQKEISKHSPQASYKSIHSAEREPSIYSKHSIKSVPRPISTPKIVETKRKSLIELSSRHRVCSSMEFDVTTTYTKLRDVGIKHANSSIVVHLQKLGVDQLLRACRPAKCCRKAILNERQRTGLPYAVSLRSLPLIADDLAVIEQSIDMSLRKIRKNTDISQEHMNNKMAFYVSLGKDDFKPNINFPWVVPVYKVEFDKDKKHNLKFQQKRCKREKWYILKPIQSVSKSDKKNKSDAQSKTHSRRTKSRFYILKSLQKSKSRSYVVKPIMTRCCSRINACHVASTKARTVRFSDEVPEDIVESELHVSSLRRNESHTKSSSKISPTSHDSHEIETNIASSHIEEYSNPVVNTNVKATAVSIEQCYHVKSHCFGAEHSIKKRVTIAKDVHHTCNQKQIDKSSSTIHVNHEFCHLGGCLPRSSVSAATTEYSEDDCSPNTCDYTKNHNNNNIITAANVTNNIFSIHDVASFFNQRVEIQNNLERSKSDITVGKPYEVYCTEKSLMCPIKRLTRSNITASGDQSLKSQEKKIDEYFAKLRKLYPNTDSLVKNSNNRLRKISFSDTAIHENLKQMSKIRIKSTFKGNLSENVYCASSSITLVVKRRKHLERVSNTTRFPSADEVATTIDRRKIIGRKKHLKYYIGLVDGNLQWRQSLIFEPQNYNTFFSFRSKAREKPVKKSKIKLKRNETFVKMSPQISASKTLEISNSQIKIAKKAFNDQIVSSAFTSQTTLPSISTITTKTDSFQTSNSKSTSYSTIKTKIPSLKSLRNLQKIKSKNYSAAQVESIPEYSVVSSRQKSSISVQSHKSGRRNRASSTKSVRSEINKSVEFKDSVARNSKVASLMKQLTSPSMLQLDQMIQRRKIQNIYRLDVEPKQSRTNSSKILEGFDSVKPTGSWVPLSVSDNSLPETEEVVVEEKEIKQVHQEKPIIVEEDIKETENDMKYDAETEKPRIQDESKSKEKNCGRAFRIELSKKNPEDIFKEEHTLQVLNYCDKEICELYKNSALMPNAKLKPKSEKKEKKSFKLTVKESIHILIEKSKVSIINKNKKSNGDSIK